LFESTDRLSNNETSPLHTEYICENQGVDAGWGDLYGSSLVCNWIDITELDTSAGPVTDTLTFVSNPDGFMCEGDAVLDEDGNQLFESTTFTTSEGNPVDRPKCEQRPGSEEDDTGSVEVTVPERGGFVTGACGTEQEFGLLRNCGFAPEPAIQNCTAGQPVSLTCTGGDASAPQVVRICETSRALATGVDCDFTDALANVVIDAASVDVDITCPIARDGTEIGGQIAVYQAPVLEDDGARTITCVP